ncbi:MAG: multicomponent Na+:H+ antiporter subunit E [Elusimicrobia bacterium]|nr:MAG: multicomponent Na+:H+ antiporter subunit E [Elusimicrobiota bacterium]KAF0157317.1 MAG: multicomponent Na+:H+ antiporter subunit E [Elusimicrobiota bacterium]
MNFIYTAAAMFLFWLALSGQFTGLLLASGAAAAVFVAALARGGSGRHSPQSVPEALRPAGPALPGPTFLLRLAAYLPWLCWQIVLSSLDVAYRVLHPARPIDPRVIKIKNPCRTPLGTALLANSITLTPGTVTLEVGPAELVVHSLSAESAASLQAGGMQRRVLRVEGDSRV